MTDCPLIAIVDDDPSVCRSLKRLLCSLGMEVETFGCGEDFLVALDAAPAGFGCIVLDVQMPGMSGFEVQDRLMSRCLPILFITAHDDAGTRQRARAAGIPLLYKPVEGEVLGRAILAALRPRA